VGRVHDPGFDLLFCMYRSVLAQHPEAKIVLLTDFATKVPRSSLPLVVQRHPVRWNNLMLDRTRAQLRCLSNLPEGVQAAFLDSDMLLLRPLFPLPDTGFDIALTWRPSADMPINGGLILVDTIRKEQVTRFFSGFLDVYQYQYADQSNWFGDQRAIRDWIGVGYREMERASKMKINDCTVLFLKCDQYNFSPDPRSYDWTGSPEGLHLLHFKGDLKRFMLPYWRAIVRPQSGNPVGALRRHLGHRQLLRLQGQTQQAVIQE
jgi:hypothetical protein